MVYKLIISNRAERHIDSILAYVAVELQNPSASRSIYSDINKAFDKLEHMAESLALCQDPYLMLKGYRKIILDRHDYVILYTVDEDRVLISGVFHILENYVEKL